MKKITDYTENDAYVQQQALKRSLILCMVFMVILVSDGILLRCSSYYCLGRENIKMYEFAEDYGFMLFMLILMVSIVSIVLIKIRGLLFEI